MTQTDFACATLQVGDVDLVNTRLFGKVDLSPAPLLSELPDSLAKLDTNIGVHSSSIDLAEALYLVDALSWLNQAEHNSAVLLPEHGRDLPAFIDKVRAAERTSLHAEGRMILQPKSRP